MKKLLIISSEYLYPNYTIGSIFELAQARILAQDFDVLILAVAPADSLSAACKRLLRTLVKGKSKNLSNEWKKFLVCLKVVISNRQLVNEYSIEGVSCFECTQVSIVSPRSFNKNLSEWVNAGLFGFKRYIAKKGKPDIIHAHGRFLNAGVLAEAIKRDAAVPYVYTEHSTFYQQGLAPNEAKKELLSVISGAKEYVSVSRSLEKSVVDFLGTTVRPAKIIPNVLEKVFEETPLRSIPPGQTFVFLCVAALEYKKGQDLLLHAFAKAFGGNPEYRLVIVGEGPYEPELKDLCIELKIQSQVQFTGRLNKEGVLGQMDAAHAMVLPSRIETFGVVVIEAFSRGLPVLSTRSGGPEFLVTDLNGFIVEPDDLPALSDAMTALAKNISRFNPAAIRNDALMKYGQSSFLESMKALYNL